MARCDRHNAERLEPVGYPGKVRANAKDRLHDKEGHHRAKVARYGNLYFLEHAVAKHRMALGQYSS
jgi:hypothetical protein